MTQRDPQALLRHSELVATREQVSAAIGRMAEQINAHFGERPIVLLIVMTGAVVPAVWLAGRLRMPLRMDFIHATRYAGRTAGGELDFRVPPRLDLRGQDVLIVDDIYDVGLTLHMIEQYCLNHGAKTVTCAVLVRKIHDREVAGNPPAFVGLEVGDRYVFGCGMDVYEHWRHLDEIRALEEDR